MPRLRPASFAPAIAAAALIALAPTFGPGGGAAAQAARGVTVVKAAPSIKETAGNSGKRYAICIGVDNYEDAEIKDLTKAGNDAAGLGAALKSAGQFDEVFVMSDDVDPRYDARKAYPRLANVRERLRYLADFIRPEDMVVVSFSGHGVADEAGDSYLVMADSRAADPVATSLPLKEIVDWLARLKVRKSLLLVDACRETVGARASRSLSGQSIRAERYERSEVAAVFFATRTGWYSYEDDETDYGVFTRFVLDGLGGKADYQAGNRDGIVTFRELSAFVEDAVSSHALARGLKQKPYTRISGESTGDLALSTYSASVDVATRSRADAASPGSAPGSGSIRIFSNVAGIVSLDGAPKGRIEAGSRIAFDDVPAGPHFVEIGHDRGTFRTDLAVADLATAEAVNLVVAPDRPYKVVAGETFVHVPGRDGSPGFWLGESEVGMGQFAEFVRQTGYLAKGEWQRRYQPAYALYPVVNVTLDDCLAYAAWLSRKAGVKVGLPTVAQRAWAAGGRFEAEFPWGDGWETEFCHGAEAGERGALPIVGRMGPVQRQFFRVDMTRDGAAHLAGNVREWCADTRTSSEGLALAAVGGGSWRLSQARYFAAGNSSWVQVTASEDDLGFRVMISGD